jgi:tetratricopeptide (TPR) repeat protein
MTRYALILASLLFVLSAFPAGADPARAEKLALEAQDMLFNRGDRVGAERKATEAIEEDRANPEIWMVRANLRSLMQNIAGALADTTEAIRLAEASSTLAVEKKAMMYYSRAAYLRNVDRFADMLPDAEKAIALVPGKKWALAGRGSALVGMGDIDGGVAVLKEAASEDPSVNGLLAGAAWLRADMDDVIASAAKQPADDEDSATFWKGVALCEQGKADEAWKLGESWMNSHPANGLGPMVMGYVEGTPGNPRTNLERSGRLWASLIDGQESNPSILAMGARTMFNDGRFTECRDLLATRGTDSNFFNLFWLGAAQWKLDQRAEARETLKAARRLNPYLKAWAAKVPGLAEFVASIDKELAGEGSAKGGALGLAKESATWLMTTAEIEVLVRRYQFGKASAEFAKLLPLTVSPARKKEIETRAAEVKFMSSALDKIVAAVNKKPGTLKTKVGGQELTLTKADASAFDFAIAKGTGKFPWAFLDFAEFLRFASLQALTPEEKFSLCVLQWDLGSGSAAQEGLAAALKASPALKDRVAGVVARKRGVEVPASGFVYFKSRFVTPEEKENLEKGLVRFRGEWVPAADRENLAQGLVKVGDKWLPGEDAKLLAAGFRKQDGKWMSGEDYQALTSQWDHAIVQETTHYTIKSNAGEAFVKDLAIVAELAWTELKAFYDGREPKLPGDEKMSLYAFGTYEDYRKWCVDHKSENYLNAAGFATSGSNVVVGWNKTGNFKLFLQTMAHEAAHLYYYRTSSTASLPSWYAEAMASYFEGFQGASGAWKYTWVNESRSALAKSALAGGNNFIPLKALLGGDALALINSDTTKALTFYAECWALNYFLTRTPDKAIAESYRKFRAAQAAGTPAAFTDFFPDLDALEKSWRAFAVGM